MQTNKQPVEKRLKTDGTILDVHSIFYTIQGEGPFAGTPAVFVRLAGCNLQCPWCDTEYTQGRKEMSVQGVADTIGELVQNPGLVVITGGEPFRQNLGPLFTALVNQGYYVQVETNGTLAPSASPFYRLDPWLRFGVFIVCSPKTGKVDNLTWDLACCVKYVLDHESYEKADGLPKTALGHSANPMLARPPLWWNRAVYLQPADMQDAERNAANIALVRDSCMQHGYILQLQIHKIIGVE